MRDISCREAAYIAGGLSGIPGIDMPVSSSGREMARSAGFGALAGLTGFSGGPIVGIGSVGLGAIVGGVAQMTLCAHDLARLRGYR